MRREAHPASRAEPIIPPWTFKRVIVPPHYEPPVEWIPLAQIRPVQSRAQSAAQSLREPSLTCYPALVVKPCGADFVLCDGHRRYYALKDAGWSGSVPVVRLRRG